MINSPHHILPPLKACAIALLAGQWGILAANGEATKPKPASAPEAPAPVRRIYISEIRVLGARSLPRVEVEEAVYPFLGPGRTLDDVEGARAALEKAYHDKGFSATQIAIPEQTGKGGIVFLQAYEGKVGTLRVKGARYFLPSNIRRQALSLAEGKVINFNDVQRDIVALNQLSDRRVTPAIRAGSEPGVVDVDLNVEDKNPLHGSIELNNRRGPNTTPLRVNASASYNNLWQLGHSFGVSTQIAPERLKDATIFSGYYIARFPGYSGISLMLQGTKQDSDVSTLGGAAVAGRGETAGIRALLSLPAGKGFYQSATLGFDYKHFNERVRFGAVDLFSPITYFPLSASYSATWVGKQQTTDFNLTANFHPRSFGDSAAKFDSKRFRADGNYIYLRGDMSHSHELPHGFQVYARAHGQVADQPLLNNEQLAGGGEGTVRGYLESSALGDNGFFGSLELRSPKLGAEWGKLLNEWRVYAFVEGGVLTLNQPLPEQQSRFSLASYGVGSRVRLANHLSGGIDFGMPLYSVSDTRVHEGFVTFRLSADF